MEEREHLLEAFESNWIAPLGPDVDAFEAEFAAVLGAPHAVALSSGTAALHLALRQVGVGPGDRVLCSTMTFVASAAPIRYLGAEPVFVDATEDSWNLDVDLVAEALDEAARIGRPYRALVAVDLYGRCCDYERLAPLCRDHGVALVEDAAEALGARHRGRAAGTFGAAGVFSFNGNKILTTSGGGMLVTTDADLAARTRHLATQAREPAAHYEHVEVGYNYRLSNLLAALGRAQLRKLEERVSRRREIGRRYREALTDHPGVHFAPMGDPDESNHWLTCLTVDPLVARVDREALRQHLRSRGIEARPVWKPMHRQPVFGDCDVLGGKVAERLFEEGLCLPSGSSLTEAEQDEVVTEIGHVLGR